MKQSNKIAWGVAALGAIVLTVALAAWVGRPVPLVIEIPPIGAEIKDLDIGRIRQGVEELAAAPSRVSGYPGAARAATRLVEQLRALGITEVEEQPVEVAVPLVKSAELEAAGPAGPTRLPLHPVWPNLARTSQTPPGGLSGPLVYAGRGTEEDLAGKQLHGAIVVLDFDCNAEWLGAAEFGGQAVLFRHSPQATGNTSRNKLLSVPANVPRFYVAPADTPALDALLAAGGTTATLHCEMDWQRVTTRNILARVTGGDTPPRPTADEQPLVLQAYYDSISVVPTLAPGAEQAISAATLLELTRFFRQLPQAPRRPVYVLFTGAHGQALQGMTQWTRTLKDGLRLGWPEAQRQSLLARMGEPGLIVGLDLSSRSPRMGLFAMGGLRGQNEAVLRPKFSKLGLTLDQFARGIARDQERLGQPQQFTDCINMGTGRAWWTYFPYRSAFSSELATAAGIPGVTLSTINDDRRVVDTPLDTAGRIGWDALAYQLGYEAGVRPGLARLAVALAYWRGPFTSSRLDDKWSRIEGRVAWLDQERDYTPNRALNGAMVFLKTLRADKYLLGTRGVAAVMSDGEGCFAFDGLIDTTANLAFANCVLEAYATSGERFERENPGALKELLKVRAGRAQRTAGEAAGAATLPRDGSIVYALDMARPADYPWTVSLVKKVHHLNLVAFPCKSFTLFGLTEPRGYQGLKDLTILDAATQSPPFQYGRSSTDLTAGLAEENCITLWADPTLRMRLTLGFGFQEKRLVLVNNTPADPVGAGFVLDQLDSIPSMVLQGARDMHNLNAWRIEKFNHHGVKNPRVQKQHDEAGQHLTAAGAALQGLDYQGYRSESEKAWALESKAYSELLSTTNDMIRGVLFYLALLIPFAYCIERLVFASGTVRARIILMITIFLVGFAILALIHPAFRFTMTPFIVLLAFIILMLAVTVSLLIVGKFDGMMQERKTELAGQHEDTVALGGIAVRAFDLGIANIRRRPQRAVLTGATIVLVTFTLLSFTSLVPETSVSKLRHPEGNPVYKGLLARDRGWGGLPTPLYEALKRGFEEQDARLGNDSLSGTAVAARAWFFSDNVGALSQIDLMPRPLTSEERTLRGDDTLTTAAANGYSAVALVGMQPSEPRITEIDKTLIAGRWFQREDEQSIIIPDRAAQYLGLGAADIGRRITVYGQDLELVGIFDSARLNKIRDIDGEEITPVNFVMTQLGKAQSGDTQKADTLDSYQHFGSEQIALVPFRFGFRLGAPIRSVAIRTAQNIDPVAEAEDFARRSSLTILASNLKTVMLLASMDTNRVSAAGQIVIPVLLGFMMVLGTMLGSVYERRREIFVYNSVGLSPTHVASLFLAESSVYAIIGACMGYLLGQIISKLLLVTGALGGIGLNYSAGTTVLVTLLTMGIVLASTLYPARQAFRAAIPEARGAEPEIEELEGTGETISLYLPFVATPTSIFAMQAYMHEFLHGLEGVSVGRLAVEDLHAAPAEDHGHPAPGLVFRAWLAPFDLGISHDARLRIVWRPERGIFQYYLTATRYSGDQQNWRRLTPWFIQAIRKQLLMWRILSAAEYRKYEQAAVALYGHATYDGMRETLTLAPAAPAAAGPLEHTPA